MFESELLTQGFSTLLNNPQALSAGDFFWGDAGYCDWRFAWSGLATMGVAILLLFHLRHGACFWIVDDLRRLFWWRLRWFYHRKFCSKFPEHLPPQPPRILMVAS
ncbi:MAG: hypothetical protein ACLR31_02520 [Escherichia coli]